MSSASPASGEPVDQPVWMSLVRHPRFREAIELNVTGVLAWKDQLSPTGKWVLNDLARAATITRICQLQAVRGEVTVGDVLARTRVRNTASDNRILQILHRAEAADLIGIEDRPGPRRLRRILIRPLTFDLLRRRTRAEIAAAAVLVPAIRPALERLADDRFLTGYMASLDRFDGMDPAVRGPPNPGLRLLMLHQVGLSMLYDLMLGQPADRPRLLTEAPFSRSHLAARFEVSRTHARRVFDEAAAAGHVSFPAADRIAFSPSLSDEAERHFALTFHVVATTAGAALRACN